MQSVPESIKRKGEKIREQRKPRRGLGKGRETESNDVLSWGREERASFHSLQKGAKEKQKERTSKKRPKERKEARMSCTLIVRKTLAKREEVFFS